MQLEIVFRRTVFLTLFSFLSGLIVLLNIYPYRPNSVIGWVVLFVFSIPIWFALELIGFKVLSISFVSKLNSSWRIIYGIIALGLLYILFWLGFRYIEPYFGQWGS